MLPLLGWGLAVMVFTAIARAIADEPTSCADSDDSDYTYDEAEKEKIEIENAAWRQFQKLTKNFDRILKNEATEQGLGKVVLSGLARVRGGQHFDFSSHFLSEQTEVQLQFTPYDYDKNEGAKQLAREELIKQIDSLLNEQVGSVLWDSDALIEARELSPKTRKALELVCSVDDIQELEEFMREASELRPRLAAAGVLKAGKSTLMNCLTGDFDNQRFKTGVVRETVKEQVYEEDGYLFVDTPGIDANEKDTKVAEEALRVADVILFVHNINGGGLDKPERLFLETIRKNWSNSSDFIDKSVIVLTHLDKKEDDREMVEADVCQQIEDIFNVCPSIVSVSSSRYLKGKREEKQLLLETSNYSELHRVIGERASSAGHKKKERYQGKIEEKALHLKNVLIDARRSQVKETEQEERDHKKAVQAFEKKIEGANKNIKTGYKVYLQKIGKDLELS
ncbi:MAG: 50S ribosome-binding GTPase [Kiritimatiellae bacterium]|nr:50S ribosome-binding GTPase [Kiritimatiellia bacterium]